MNCLNIGCGTRYIVSWTNIDFEKSGETVIAHNLLEGIPFEDKSFDVVYHSHVLEHFTKRQGQLLMSECYRVLKPGGVLRIAVPNLEEIAKHYLRNLDAAHSGAEDAKSNYEWIILEMLDQLVRNKSGGDMASYWKQVHIPNEDYIIQRLGCEFTVFRRNFIEQSLLKNTNLVRKAKNSFVEKLRRKILVWISNDKNLFKYLSIGRFRSSGEIHQWMYDRYSLQETFKTAGFEVIKQVSAMNSMIEQWENYQWLDVEDGKVRKPDSLFMEGKK